ncbi:MAG TPA: rhodanese-like domain-containing protein [Gemmatimonadales bacterium]|nr:rhodanese-like domain-containing protein [Gemmatimonadales bacterium]
MLLKRFYDNKLAQASYLVGCAATGEALVVDPNRNAEEYVAAAAGEGLRITHVTETHIHADYVSGSRELAARTGARMYLSAEGGPDWQYEFAAADGATLLRDHDTFMVGNIRIEVLHTPGHTPEHLSFLVTDTAATEAPMGVFTGDFVFVGDVGRPDLLERAAKVANTMEAGARQLYASIQRFKELPDHLQIWPGHGAGSACGKSLGAVPQTTLGYERVVNWGLTSPSEAEFVREVLEGQPDPPRYFAEMKRINREGPRVLGAFARPRAMRPAELSEVLARGAMVVDTRSADAFAAGHVPGMINLPLNKSFTTWAGWFLPYDADFYLLTTDGARALDETVRDLATIGLDRVAGWFSTDAIAAWAGAGRTLETVRQMKPAELAAELGNAPVAVLDVRSAGEWEAGHLPDVPNIPLGQLPGRMAEVPAGRPLVLQCQGGGRSAIAASILQARGIKDVVNLSGGFGAWEQEGRPVERPAAPVVAG